MSSIVYFIIITISSKSLLKFQISGVSKLRLSGELQFYKKKSHEIGFTRIQLKFERKFKDILQKIIIFFFFQKPLLGNNFSICLVVRSSGLKFGAPYCSFLVLTLRDLTLSPRFLLDTDFSENHAEITKTVVFILFC